MKIADLFMALFVDEQGLVDQITRAGEKGGDAGGTAAAKSMAKGWKSAAGTVFKVGAAAVAAGFGIATAEGIKLNSVLNELQAETGAVGDDWTHMQAVVRRENGRTTESLDEIADATKAMRQDLGLTGVEIDRYADKFFDAGLATRTNAATMVRAVHEIGDAYGLTIDRSIGVIDQLIASQQKWGGDLQERIAAMPGFAKVINALGGSVDDAIALENIAARSGLNLTDVQKALNGTVAKFKMPVDLRTLLGAKAITRTTPVKTLQKDLDLLEKSLQKLLPPTAFSAFLAEVNQAKTPYDKLVVAQKVYNDTVAKFQSDPIQAYLDVLTAIPDQQDRARKAIELFGPKAGPIWAQLASKVAETGGSLEDFTVTADQAGDKIGQIADQLGKDPGRAIAIALETVNARLADLGSNPALSGLASIGTVLGGFAPNLGPKIGGALVRGFKGIGLRIAKVLGIELASSAAAGAISPAAEAIGSMTSKQIAKRLAGTAAADALGVGLSQGLIGAGESTAVASAGKGLAARILSAIGPIAIVTTVVASVAVIGDQAIQGFRDDFVKKLQDAIASGDTNVMDQLLKDAEGSLRGSKAGHLGDAAIAFWQGQVDAVKLAIANRAAGIGPAVATGIDQGAPAIDAAAKDAVSGVPDAVAAVGPAAATEGKKLPQEIADGIRSARAAPQDAFSQLQDDLKHQMTRTQEAAKLAGELTSKALAAGLRSKDPLVKAEAIAVRDSIVARLQELKSAGPLGRRAMDFLNAGLHSKIPAIRAAAREVKGTIERHAKPNTKPIGERGGKDVAAGLNDPAARAAVVAKIGGLVRFIESLLTISPHVNVHATVQQTQNKRERQHGGDVAANQAYIVGERRPELFVPNVAGHVYPTVGEGLAIFGGGDQVTVNVPVTGLPLAAETPRDIASTLIRVRDTGFLSPRRRLRFAPIR